MLGYPNIIRDNPYLTSRLDGITTDSRPCGRGICEEQDFPGANQTFEQLYELEVPLSRSRGPADAVPCRAGTRWPLGASPTIRPGDRCPTCCWLSSTSGPLDRSGLASPWSDVWATEQCWRTTEVSPGGAGRERGGRRRGDLRDLQVQPSVSKPSWYAPADEEENLMRWS